MSDNFCPNLTLTGYGALTECVGLDSCPSLLDSSQAPANQTLPCGFDEDKNLMKICCPADLVDTSSKEDISQKPRFPNTFAQARKVEDITPMCQKWKQNGACALDRHFNDTYLNNSAGEVKSRDMFSFMVKACMSSCGWAPEGGRSVNHHYQFGILDHA